MKIFFNKNKKATFIIGMLSALVFGESIYLAKLLTQQKHKDYTVNLVKINNEKDSIDYPRMKNDLVTLDAAVQRLRTFLVSKNIPVDALGPLPQDSLSDAVHVAKVSNRYSQYLTELEQKLQVVPLGMPSGENGYISSNFGKRKNPIPPKPTILAQSTQKSPINPEPEAPSQIIEQKDSLGNVVSRTVIPAAKAPVIKNGSPAAPRASSGNSAPAEADQMQFHKGIDIGLPFGSDVRATAAGTVIFAGEKGGYGLCVIISHGNGLDTLYAHLSQTLVEANDRIKVGQIIAKSGNSGRSTGPHLHYEVHKNSTPVNPRLFLNL